MHVYRTNRAAIQADIEKVPRVTFKTSKERLFPVNNYHNLVLEAATDPEASPYYHEKNIIRWAFRVSPGLPERLVKRGFTKLVGRHDSLRLRFVGRRGAWQAEILEEHPTGLQIEDISALSQEAQNAHVLRRSLQHMTALSDPLFEAVLFKGGKAGDVLMLRGQHAILDGYSLVLLIEDMIKIIMNMPLGTAPPSYEDYITRNLRKAAEQHAKKEAFWRENLLPGPGDLNIGRKAKGLPPNSWTTTGKSVHLKDILSTAQSRQLAARSKATGVTAFAYFYAAYAETLCALAGQSEMIVNSVIGRFDAAIQNVVCADQQPIGIRYICDPGNLEQRAVWLSDMLQKTMAASPTNALLPEGEICQSLQGAGTQWFRFLALSPLPTGRMSASPFSKMFERGMGESLHLGPLTFETLNLAGAAQIDSEVELTFALVGGLPNATLKANAEAYDLADLTSLSAGIKSRLDAVPQDPLAI